MKIAIFDPTGYHGHYAYTQAIIFENDTIDWFIHKKIQQRLSDLNAINKSSRIHQFSGKFSKIFFYLKSIYYINFKKWDVVFFNTLHSDWLLNFLFFIFLKRSKNIVLTIHNINSFFTSNKSQNISALLKQKTKKLALNNCKLNVYGSKLKKHLLSFHPNAEVFLLPFHVYNATDTIVPAEAKNKITIAIPGTVDIKRRNYHEVLELIEKLSAYPNFHIVLLGKPVGQGSDELLSEFEKFPETVTCYRNFVDEEEFEKQMKNADLIWGPLHRFFETDDAIEEYGISKETGITFAIIRYALPGIIPANITIMDEISSGIKFYTHTSEIFDFLMGIHSNIDILTQMKKESFLNAQKFNRDTIKQQFINQMFNKTNI